MYDTTVHYLCVRKTNSGHCNTETRINVTNIRNVDKINHQWARCVSQAKTISRFFAIRSAPGYGGRIAGESQLTCFVLLLVE